jgi:hypothetical protein
MYLLYTHNKKIETEQKKFVINSLMNSFPQSKFFCINDKIYAKNKFNISAIKKSCVKLIKLTLSSNPKNVIFYQRSDKKYFKNPVIELKKKKQITKIAEGIFQYQGEFLKIFRATNKYFFDLAINKYKAIDQENPVLWPLDLYNKINYFSDFPQQILMISGLKKNYKNYKFFSRKYGGKKKFKNIKLSNHFRNSEYGLQPAVCDNCYYALQNLKFYKNTIYTTYNKVFRDEKSNFDNLDRLISFSVRDIMFVGDKKFVLKIRDELIKSIKKFFSISKLNCTIEVANDPFFISNVEKKIYQDALDLKYEILADIPFLKKKIAVGSINFHLNIFGKAFKISNKGKSIFSGCIGIGFERLLLALYSQHGTNLKLWPKNFKKLIKIIP